MRMSSEKPQIPAWSPIMAEFPGGDEIMEAVSQRLSGGSSMTDLPEEKMDVYSNMVAEKESTENLVRYETNDAELAGEKRMVEEANMETIALKALHIDDDPTLNPWTFRMFLLGTCRFLYKL